MSASSLPTLTFPSVGTVIPRPFHGPLRNVLIRALRLCPLPQHVAFIMDGNRRAARQEGVEAIKGHEKGFDALRGVSRKIVELALYTDFTLHSSLNSCWLSLYPTSPSMPSPSTISIDLRMKLMAY